MTRFSFPREIELSGLVGKALFLGVERDAMKRAATSAASCYIVRGFHGFKVVNARPPFGEFWEAGANGTVTHVAGPVI